jgi:hypothetical protein
MNLWLLTPQKCDREKYSSWGLTFTKPWIFKNTYDSAPTLNLSTYQNFRFVVLCPPHFRLSTTFVYYMPLFEQWSQDLSCLCVVDVDILMFETSRQNCKTIARVQLQRRRLFISLISVSRSIFTNLFLHRTTIKFFFPFLYPDFTLV